MRRIFFVSIVALLFSRSAFAGGFVTGNGGFGVLRDGHYVLYDLDEAGVTPFHAALPHAPRIALPDRLIKIAAILDIPFDTLSIRIAVIDHVAPGLGQQLAEAIAFYDWKMVDRFTGATLDACPECRQIAVRSARSIEVDSFVWSRMEPLHRLALVLHEAAFALMDPGLCAAESRRLSCVDAEFKKIREVVALMLSSPLAMARLRGRAVASLRYSRRAGAANVPSAARLFAGNRVVMAIELNGFLDRTMLADFAASACSATTDGQALSMRVSRGVFRLVPVTLTDTIYGPQYFLTHAVREPRRRVSVPFRDDSACAAKLAHWLQEWFEGQH